MPKMPTRNEPPRELIPPPNAAATGGSVEILRAWVVDGGLEVSLAPVFKEPGAWGMLLVDVARHAARAYAAEGVATEAEAMKQIRRLFEAEIARPTDLGRTQKISEQ